MKSKMKKVRKGFTHTIGGQEQRTPSKMRGGQASDRRGKKN
jgi:hypothetical protein